MDAPTLSGQIKEGDIVVATWEAKSVPILRPAKFGRGFASGAADVEAYECRVEHMVDGHECVHNFIVANHGTDPVNIAGKALGNVGRRH